MTKKRNAYRRRSDKKTEKPIIEYESNGKWHSIKGKQTEPVKMFARMRLDGEEIGHDGRAELERALKGESSRIDRYDAARMIVLDALQRGVINSDPPQI